MHTLLIFADREFEGGRFTLPVISHGQDYEDILKPIVSPEEEIQREAMALAYYESKNLQQLSTFSPKQMQPEADFQGHIKSPPPDDEHHVMKAKIINNEMGLDMNAEHHLFYGMFSKSVDDKHLQSSADPGTWHYLSPGKAAAPPKSGEMPRQATPASETGRYSSSLTPTKPQGGPRRQYRGRVASHFQ